MSVEDDTNKYNSTVLHSLKLIYSARDEHYINSDNYLKNRISHLLIKQMTKCVVHRFIISMLSVNYMHISYHSPMEQMYPQ